MTFSDELILIRKYLRDPTGSIWSDAFIRHVYNDVQNDFQNKTKLFFDVAVQRVPGVYAYSYTHDWEFGLASGSEDSMYRCLYKHDQVTFCYRWEVQEYAGIDSDVTESGMHFTQPWEAYCTEPAEEVRFRFPVNFHQMVFIAHDEAPISPLSRKEVQRDQSHLATQGLPIGYYVTDHVDNSYVLYPRPNVGFVHELDNLNGSTFFASDDTEDATTGIIAERDETFDSGFGLPVDLIGAADNIFMVYEARPLDVDDGTSESDYPDFVLKYIRYGTIARAYGGNNDGKIKSLAQYWAGRYQSGIDLIKQYQVKKKQDRDYRFTTKGVSNMRQYRHARLPSTYPPT